MQGLPHKRLIGFEPTTFCMAIRPVTGDFAAQSVLLSICAYREALAALVAGEGVEDEHVRRRERHPRSHPLQYPEEDQPGDGDPGAAGNQPAEQRAEHEEQGRR